MAERKCWSKLNKTFQSYKFADVTAVVRELRVGSLEVSSLAASSHRNGRTITLITPSTAIIITHRTDITGRFPRAMRLLLTAYGGLGPTIPIR